MKNYVKIALVAIMILAIASIISTNLTGYVINKYEYTTAICDENNFCQDNIITCENNKLTNIAPITGASIQLSNDWVDIRENQFPNYCK